MKRLLLSSVGVLALTAAAIGVASAQTSTTTGAATTGTASATDMTCDQFAALESDQQERALYFIAGFQAAQAETGTSASADTTTGATPGANDTTAQADTGAAGTTTPGATPGAGDTTASTTTPGAAQETDATTTAGTSASGDLSSMGIHEIPLENVMSFCQDSPTATVTEAINQQTGTGTDTNTAQ